MDELKDGEQIHTYIHIVFSDKVKTREQLIEMMMDKLSFDCRVEDWSYVTNLAAINAKLKVYWQDAKDDLAKAQAEVERLREGMRKVRDACIKNKLPEVDMLANAVIDDINTLLQGSEE